MRCSATCLRMVRKGCRLAVCSRTAGCRASADVREEQGSFAALAVQPALMVPD